MHIFSHARIDEVTYPDMVYDLKHFLEENQLENAVLIGVRCCLVNSCYMFLDTSRKSNPSLDLQHSMGGKVAAMTALLHRNLVSGLAVLDIAPVSYLVTNMILIH